MNRRQSMNSCIKLAIRHKEMSLKKEPWRQRERERERERNMHIIKPKNTLLCICLSLNIFAQLFLFIISCSQLKHSGPSLKLTVIYWNNALNQVFLLWQTPVSPRRNLGFRKPQSAIRMLLSLENTFNLPSLTNYQQQSMPGKASKWLSCVFCGATAQ